MKIVRQYETQTMDPRDRQYSAGAFTRHKRQEPVLRPESTRLNIQGSKTSNDWYSFSR